MLQVLPMLWISSTAPWMHARALKTEENIFFAFGFLLCLLLLCASKLSSLFARGKIDDSRQFNAMSPAHGSFLSTYCEHLGSRWKKAWVWRAHLDYFRNNHWTPSQSSSVIPFRVHSPPNDELARECLNRDNRVGRRQPSINILRNQSEDSRSLNDR